jgi:hypothetical protein
MPSLEHDRVYCFLRKLPKLAISHPWANAKREQTFQSDLPKHVSADDLPDSICYRDIGLFILIDQIASMMFFVPSLSFAISKAGQ